MQQVASAIWDTWMCETHSFNKTWTETNDYHLCLVIAYFNVWDRNMDSISDRCNHITGSKG
jgi:hypothetical protein